MEPVKPSTARDWTVAEVYELLPESGTRRHELIDGELVVSPEASEHHQFRIFELATLLRASCPGHLRVSGGAINLDIGQRRHLQPDLAVKRVEDFGVAESVPLLVVEVLSPSTWQHDGHRKREIYRDLGVPAYWLVEPVTRSVTVLELADDDYVEVAHIEPGEVAEVTVPFPVRLAPDEWAVLD